MIQPAPETILQITVPEWFRDWIFNKQKWWIQIYRNILETFKGIFLSDGINFCRNTWIETMDKSIFYFAYATSSREPKDKVAQRREDREEKKR